MPDPKPLIEYFKYDHLPARLQTVSRSFHDLAVIVNGLKETDPREKAVALRKLLEAKDAAVRSVL